jgi:uncharacterized RDD family membrane protein YckC
VAEVDIKNPASGKQKNMPENLLPSTTAGRRPSRRTTRVSLNILIIVSGETNAGSFSEESRTVNVNVHGALILLATKVADSQLIKLTNRSTSEQQVCRVVTVKPASGGNLEAGVEFTQPDPNFWRVAFPPADWIQVEAITKPEALLPLPRKRAEARNETNAIPDIDPTSPTYAGFWLRLVAASIDALILGALLWAGGFLANSIVPWGRVISPDGLYELAIVVMVAFVNLYFIVMERSSWQATCGKKMLRLYVTDMTGRRITLGCATGRTYAKYASVMTLGMGFIASAFTEQKQALHDKISSSLVLRHR